MNRTKVVLLSILVFLGIACICAYFLARSQQPMLRILTGYVAKNACSCIFVADRDAESVRAEDLGYGLLTLGEFEVDYEEKSVRSNAYGMVERKAIFRPGLGCILEGEETPSIANFERPRRNLDSDTLFWPQGNKLKDTLLAGIDIPELNEALDSAFSVVSTRAVVVVKDGQLIAERYKEGFDKNTPQLGWSMNKSVVNTLIGILVKQGKLDKDASAPVSDWANDERREITLSDLLQMSSGLQWEERYDEISDATKMLFESDNMSGYAASLPLEFKPGQEWEYSSGTTNILSQIIRNTIAEDHAYWEFPYTQLMHKIGADTYYLETDANGNFVGSSYGWASARDWARFGLLFLNDGVWNGERILPEGWVDYSFRPAPASDGVYGAQFWLDAPETAPADTYYCGGFDGQYIYIIPSKNMVVVRLGIDGLAYMDEHMMMREIMEAITE